MYQSANPIERPTSAYCSWTGRRWRHSHRTGSWTFKIARTTLIQWNELGAENALLWEEFPFFAECVNRVQSVDGGGHMAVDRRTRNVLKSLQITYCASENKIVPKPIPLVADDKKSITYRNTLQMKKKIRAKATMAANSQGKTRTTRKIDDVISRKFWIKFSAEKGRRESAVGKAKSLF